MGSSPKVVRDAASSSPAPQYALVAYVRHELGHFVEGLRSDLYPEHSHLAAHITVLPPRVLCRSESEAIAELRQTLSGETIFEVTLGDIQSFSPTTPTVYIRVDGAADRFRELHRRLNQGAFCFTEQWQYEPHLTIVKMPHMEQAEEAFRQARARWSAFTGARRLSISELTFVREGGKSNHWVDLDRFPLRPAP